MTIYIYALRDPETLAVHYIGQSKDPMGRLAGHRNSIQIAMHAWIMNLRERGLAPLLEILEVCSETDAGATENRLIVEHRMQGAPLVNMPPWDTGDWDAWRAARAGYAPPPLSTLTLPPPVPLSRRTHCPPLYLSLRPKQLSCGCGQKPRCGYLDQGMTVFYCEDCEVSAP